MGTEEAPETGLLERAEAAERKLAEVRTVLDTFFAHYGNSELPTHKRALALAHGIRQVLDRDKNSSDEGEVGGYDRDFDGPVL
jgi:hypothetical protein